MTKAEIINRWDLATGREERAEKAEEVASKTKREARLEKGRILRDARKLYPATGRSAGGWGELLKELRTDDETARRLMKLAVEVDGENPLTSTEMRGFPAAIPTYAQAGIVTRAPKIEPDDPMPEDERAELVERLHREEEDRRQAALVPLRMETRETASARALNAFERGIEALNQMHSEGVHITDCTSSPTDFERVKSRALTLYRMVREELARIGIEADAEPPTSSTKRQLTLVTGE